MATIANVQAPKYGSAAANNVTVSWNSTPTAGNLLIARAIGAAASDGGSISGWTRVDPAMYGSTSGYVAIFFKIAGASEGNVTVTFTGATTTRLVIEEWSNSAGWDVNPKDQDAHADRTSSVTSKSTGTTGSTAVADELSVSVIGWGGTVTGISWSNSFTADFSQPTGSLTFAGAHKVLSATGTVETTASWTTSRLAGAAVATFKGSVAITGNLGQTTETDEAPALAKAKRLSTGQPSEAGAVFAMSAAKLLRAGVVAETDTDPPLNRAKRREIGLALETNEVLTLARAKQLGLGILTETDVALSLNKVNQLGLGFVTETDVILSPSRIKRLELGVVTETGVILLPSRMKRREIGQTLEADEALPVTLSGNIDYKAIDVTVMVTTQITSSQAVVLEAEVSSPVTYVYSANSEVLE